MAKRKMKIEPFEWAEFSEAQLNSIYESTARINIWEGSVRSGKTIASIVRWLEYVKEGPKGDLLMVAKTERTLKRNILDLIQSIVGTSNFRHVQGAGELFLFGRRIYLVGANDERSENKIRGMTLAGAYGDETTLWPSGFFKMLLTRLSVKGSKLFATTNPDTPNHWMLKDYLEKTNLNLKRFSFTLDDNLSLDPDYVRDLKNEFSGVFYDRFILGKWVLAEGVIYSMFSKAMHIVQAIDRRFVEYYVSIDYGTQNPTVFGLWGKQRRDGKWYKVKEYHHSGRDGVQKTDSEYSADLKEFTKGIRIKGIIVDPSAASFIAQLKKDGFRVRKADNSVKDGIRNMATALKTGMIAYYETCKETIKEIGIYSWDEKAGAKGEDKPIKVDDHHMDADRYFVQTILFKPGAYVSSVNPL